MKLYAHMTRFQYRRLWSKRAGDTKLLAWGSTLKPGDIVSTCQGFNSRIASIEAQRVYAHEWLGKGSATRKGWFINEFKVIDTDEYWHYFPTGGGCVSYPETVERIKTYWLSWTGDWLERWYDGDKDKIAQHRIFPEAVQKAFRSDRYPVDSDGVLLPEFAKLRAETRV